MRIALYARVSTSRQQQTHTIEQQLTRLRLAVAAHSEWSLADEHLFCDDGASGATLKRTGLDHLRDQAAQGAFGLILMATPDRLARNYVHQMVLLEEFARVGCQVQFLDQPMTDDPHDHLLLQIRGAVAEYERTLIAERMRRGRLAGLQNGHLLPWTRVPYGYQAHPEHPRDARLLTIHRVHAAIVTELFQTYADGGVSLHQLALRLTERHIPSPTGRPQWNVNSIRLLLQNPCYTGTAYANRIQSRQAQRRKSPLQPIGSGQSWTFTPREQWIPFTVPAIISQDLFDRAQARLRTNQRTAQRNTQHDYLLRCLVQCGQCTLQCQGRYRGPHHYYLCAGHRDAVSNGHATRCRSRHIPADQLDTLVWQDLCALMQDSTLITRAMERAQGGAWVPEELQHRQQGIQAALRSLDAHRERLLTAYLAGVIELAEFERRQRELVAQRDDLQTQGRTLNQTMEQLQHLQTTIPALEGNGVGFREKCTLALKSVKNHQIEHEISKITVPEDGFSWG